jgi:hypothetical protein
MIRNSHVRRTACACAIALAMPLAAQADTITGKTGNQQLAPFDIAKTEIARQGDVVTFSIAVSGKAGTSKPAATGKLAGANVYSYVWPTSLNSSVIGFEKDQGILALAVTSHPDFDDTPAADENGDDDKANDGDLWHSHWVVLGPDDACGKGALKVIDIPEGAKPKLPATWPGLPLLIDSPGFAPELSDTMVTVKVPAASLGDISGLRFDGVTAGLRVNASAHAPLLCVADVFDIASGDLSLPGTVTNGQ